MKWIATFFTLLALAATGLAGQELHGALSQPTPQAAPAQVARAVADVVEVANVATTPRWPALFGEPQPPKPPEPEPVVEEAKQEPQPPKPPLSSRGYELKGIVRAGDAVWGLVSHPTGEKIMRVGDRLADDLPIARIDETGLWVDTGGEEPELLGFPETR